MRTIEIDNLILVEVPKDARNFTLIESHTYFKSPRIEHSTGGFDLDRKFDYKIIGLIETPDLNFDFEVDDSMVKNIGNNPLITGNAYPNYINKYQFFETKKESFITLIQKEIRDACLVIKGNLLLIKKLK